MFTYAIAKDDNQLAAATALIKRRYEKSGYVKEDDEPVIASWLHRPTAITFTAHYNETLVGTISLVLDGQDGLPMDVIYREELAPFRVENQRLAEVCQFAIDSEILKSQAHFKATIREAELALGLLAHTVRLGIHKEIDYFVFTINPKHKLFYESLGARLIGEQKSYPSVNDAPALAYVLPQAVLEDGKAAQYGASKMLVSQLMHYPCTINF